MWLEATILDSATLKRRPEASGSSESKGRPPVG